MACIVFRSQADSDSRLDANGRAIKKHINAGVR